MKYARLMLLLLLSMALFLVPVVAEESDEDENDQPELNTGLVSGLEFRNLGPALMSGRVSDIAVDPVKKSTWYIAVASGNVWKTVNAGTTFEPIFDSYGSYSIGCVTVDPNNRHVVWVGTGENNSQRSVAYGDGVYKSINGGKSFENMGLKNSEHIGKILVDPRNSDVVYVAAQGPLWAAGGDRGLYKTTDGGKTWELILDISENTGVTDIHFDPRNPDIIYAAAYQRRRHIWVLLDGGPESGVYKSTDAGANWRKINKGLPGGDKGRIGLAVSPMNPDVLYAIVEATPGNSGFYRSHNAGENWSKMSSYCSGSPQYYNEIFADPHVFDLVYSMDTRLMYTRDGGRNFARMKRQWKHVDDHAMWIDPDDPDHLLVGCDGGLYETWDWGENWDFKANLPITQFYKMAVDYDFPFYNVYGGTQDNSTQGGPSRTSNRHGIRNSDWFITTGGDGFDPAVDPEDPDIVYSQSQYGGLIRFDRKTGEEIDIQPRENREGPALRWNWSSPFIISPHSPSRLYYGSQILFRSEDRGQSWTAVSPDLSRNIDRNKLKVMGRVWSVDAVAKNWNTSFYGALVSLNESPLKEGLLYAGTDDGLIQVSENGGNTWTRYERFADVPETSYVADIEPSLFDTNTVYAVIDNHKRGDFKPYVIKSTDRGKTWKSIAGDLPERGHAHTIAQDHVNEKLLFVGTEFGVFFTVDEGQKWIQLKSGIPTIAVRDLEIQRRENDLAAGSFGRGFYILDDYTPLRSIDEQSILRDVTLFPIKNAWWYMPSGPLGWGEKASQGASFFTAPNPPFGATFTYYLKESLKTKKSLRKKEEKKVAKEGGDVFYPTWKELKAEDREENPAVILTIRDEDDNVVRRIEGSTSSGVHRTTWDLRYPGYSPTRLNDDGNGPMALPGWYTVSIDKRVDGVTTQLVEPTPFELVPLGRGSLPVENREAVLAFQQKTGGLFRAVTGANAAAEEAEERLEYVKATVEKTPALDPGLRAQARDMEIRLMDLREAINGDPLREDKHEPSMPGLLDRLYSIIYGQWWTTTTPTETQMQGYEIAAAEFAEILDDLRQLIEVDLVALEEQLEAAGAPWTPGRGVPDWEP